MTSPIFASAALRTAEGLAGRGAPAGRPALMDLRRATSTAYYALFHQITRHSVFSAVSTATEADVARVARWHTHTGVRRAAESVVRASAHGAVPKDWREGIDFVRAYSSTPVEPVLLETCEIFVELQNRRHEADYDHAYDPVRFVTLGHVDRATRGVAHTRSMWRAGRSSRPARTALHAQYERFLRLCLVSSGAPKAR